MAALPHVLLVEDNIVIRRFTSYLLTGEGFEVDMAENGLVALEKMKIRLPDVVICDMMMPEMNGFEFVEAVKKIPEFATIPVIMLSATYHEEDVKKLQSMGVAGYITKPYASEMLLGMIRSNLR